MSQLITEATAIRELHVGFSDAEYDPIASVDAQSFTRYGRNPCCCHCGSPANAANSTCETPSSRSQAIPAWMSAAAMPFPRAA